MRHLWLVFVCLFSYPKPRRRYHRQPGGVSRAIYQNHTWTIWYIWRLKTKILRLQVENKYDAHRVRNFIVLAIFMFSIILTWNFTPFWHKTLFSISKTGRVIVFFPLHLYTHYTASPHIFWPSQTINWPIKLHY